MERPKIIFDLFGVITAEPFFATNVVFPVLQDQIDHNLFKKRYILYCVGMITRDEFWDGIASGGEIALREAKIYAATASNREMLDFIKQVSTTHDLAIASEAPSSWANAILNQYGVAGYFKQLFFSSDLHATKPFHSFFKHVFTAGEPVLYIDDTLENVKAASQYGAKPIWYKGRHEEPGITIIPSTDQLEVLL